MHIFAKNDSDQFHNERKYCANRLHLETSGILEKEYIKNIYLLQGYTSLL